MGEPFPAAPGRSRSTAILVGVLLAAVTLATLSPLLGAHFINFDDPIYVTENARVKAGITWDNIRWAFGTTYFGFYYPLTWLSHMLDCQVFGLWAGGHHLTSLLIHAASTLLLFGLLRRLTGALWPSAAVAALFALHPLHVESVAWISERKDVLSTLFLLLALWAYEAYARKPCLRRYLAVFVFFLLGLMAKSMIVTAPALMLLLDFWPLGRMRLGGNPGDGPAKPQEGGSTPLSFVRLLVEKIPLFVLSLAFIGVTLYTQKGATGSLGVVSLGTRLLNAGISYVGYIAKMFVPADLAIFYPYDVAEVTLRRAAPAFLLLVLVTLLAWRWRARRPWVLMGWLWYLGALLPVIGILQVGDQASADRYTYVSLIGLFVAVVWSAAEVPLPSARAKTIATAAATCLILAFAGMAWVQAGTWHDSETVFRHALQVTPGSFQAHTQLGAALVERGDRRGAADQLKAALQFAPRNANLWGNLGGLFKDLGELDEAAACYQRVQALDPEDARACAGLAQVREAQGRLTEAETAFREAVALAPKEAPYRIDLGRIEAQQGHDGEARSQFAEAARLDASSGRAFYYVGLLDAKEGRLAEAEADYRKAMALAPDLPQPRIKLGKLLLAQGRADEARALFREALRLDPASEDARACLERESGSDAVSEGPSPSGAERAR